MSTLLFNQIFSLENMEKAYKQSLKAEGKYKHEALIFQRNETINLERLRNSLFDRSYQFSGYNTFKVYEPKERVINAPHYKDKIVQLAMNNVLKDIFIPTFISDSYACMDKRGTHKAVEKVQKHIRKSYWEYGKAAYISKVDVSKFFYSIDRDILKKLYRKKIKEADVLWIMDTIVDSGGLVSDVGLPLGNTMSQLCANIYLDTLDQYCKRYLGYKYYVRYADDIIIILSNKREAKRATELCKSFLTARLNLVANPKKTQIFPINQGVNAYGFKIYRSHRLLRDDSKKKLKRKIKKMPGLIAQNKMTVDKANQMLGSWSGHAKYADSLNFLQSIVDKRPYIALDGSQLKIDEEELKCYIEKMKNSS